MTRVCLIPDILGCECHWIGVSLTALLLTPECNSRNLLPGSIKMSSEGTSAVVETYELYPFTMERGEGMWVYDTSGKRYLDLYGGHAVAILGHRPRAVIDALTQQAEKLFFYSNLAPLEIRDRAAATLVAMCPRELNKVFFCNSGAEANENALKIAIQLTGRSKIVGAKRGWHGRSLLCCAATDDPNWEKLLGAWYGPHARIDPDAAESVELIDQETAAVILEPIQSIGGVRELGQSFLERVRRRCDQVGAMLIFDEIQTGLGRTGLPFVSGFGGVLPDMMTLAKGLASGFPIGAVVMQSGIAGSLKRGDLGSTFGGGPLAMAAMQATLESIQQCDLAENARQFEAAVRSQLAATSEIVKINGRGCLLGLELNRAAKPLQQALLKRAVIVGTSGVSNVLRLLPPLIAQPEHANTLAKELRETLACE